MNREVKPISCSPERFRPFDYIKISVFGFALTAIWSSLHSIILPLRLLDFVDEAHKNTYLGLLTFAGLILAMAVQPIFGTISDCSTSRWGQRRPYVLLGAIMSILVLPGIALADSYALIFIAYCMLQLSTNIAQCSYQAFIPDMVPEKKRGLASGVKGLIEVLGGVALVRLVAYLMGRNAAGEGSIWLWLTFGGLVVVLLVATLITVLMVKEQPGTGYRLKLPSLSTILKSFKIDVKTNRDFTLFLVARGLMGMPGVILQVFALYYLRDVVGIDNPAASAANLLIAVGICLLLTVYPAGRLSDRVGRRTIIIFSGIIGALAIVLLFFSHSFVQILVAGGFLGIANGALISSSWALATDLSVKGEEAKTLGLTNLAMAGGSALARLIGPVIDGFNNVSSGLGYKVMLFVCCACFLAGVLVIAKIKKSHIPSTVGTSPSGNKQ
jgi:Na+/melibiose symporter-like transporter